MTKLKVKTLFVSVLLATVAVCLAVGLSACKGGDKDSGKYGVGEEGVYYYDKDSTTEYLMTLQSGNYMISAEGEKSYSGTYSYNEESKSVSFKDSEGEGFAATFSDDAMQLAIEDMPYTFLKRVSYTVTFVDGNSSVASSVVYGRKASAPETDETRIFIGWYEDAAFTTQYRFDTAVTGDMTLYAYYIDIDATIANYDVTFIDGGETVYETKTQNGVVYDIPDYDGILGWWVSDTNEEDALTYKYDGQILNEATKLFAVKEGSLGASVYDGMITWEATVSSVTVTIDGTTSFSASGNSQVYDFASLGTGTHSIVVAGGNYSQELVYVVNGLSRVSNFSVYGNVLVYNGVENAQYYYVSVTCGNPSHDHTMAYNGNTLTYDFSNCEMGKEGISFTVYAYAAGYVESVSETFVYSLALDGTTVKIDSATDTATWTAVAGASGYEVYIDGKYVDTVTGTEYSFKYYDIDTEIKISVKPVAPGYYSEVSEEASYKKSTLRTPEITGINAYTVSWSYVEGASNYIIYVNGKQFETVSGDITSYALMGDPDFVEASTYTITVKAVNAGNTNQNSQLSDEIYATDGELAELLVYEDGVVYWQYAMAAGTYYVSVNDGDETTVEGKNSFDVTFDRSGENVIKVWFTNEDGNRSLARLSVTAYAIIFDSRAGTSVDTMYVAKGDKVNLPELTSDDYEIGLADFNGWYTLPDLSGNYDATSYSGEGTQFVSGTVFDYNSTLILYGYWDIEQIKVTLNAGSDGTFADGTTYEDQIAYGSDTYTLEVPETTDPTKMFFGWYTGENGRGTRYSDEYGNAISGTRYAVQTQQTLYAYWITVLQFEVTSYQNETVLSVSKGADIDRVKEVTVPAKAVYNGTEYTVGVVESGAFKECDNLVTINLPDTIMYIATANSGYSAGSGAFSRSKLQYVNIIPYEGTYEKFYYSVDGVLFYKDNIYGTIELIYYPYGKTASSYTIPSTVTNEYEFESEMSTEPVVRDVVSLATRVFHTHYELEYVTIPTTITTVGTEAFYYCTSLKTVVFEEGEDDALNVGENAFRMCTSLVSVSFCSRLSGFTPSIFTDDDALTTIIITGTNANYSTTDGLLLTADGSEIVFCPKGWAGELQVGLGGTSLANVNKIGDEAFANCMNVTSVEIGPNVTYIGERAFYYCSGIGFVTFTDYGQNTASSATLEIAYEAFYHIQNKSFTSLNLPARLVTLGERAFGYCSYLTTVYYDALEDTSSEDLDFAEYAFGSEPTGNGSILGYVTKVVLGANVPVIDIAGIFGRNSLKTVEIDGDNPYYTVGNGGVVVYTENTTNVFFCLTTATGTITLENTVLTISEEAFIGCTNVTEVVLNDGITTIGKSAFSGCTSLKKINLPEGLVTIEDEAFYNCTSLTSITLPASLEKLGEYDGSDLKSMEVFTGCTSLGEIDVAEGSENFIASQGVLYLAEKVDDDEIEATELLFCPVNNSATEITIPSTITYINSGAFKDNAAITKVSFENGEVDGELTIGDGAFQGALNLQTIELPKGLTSIGASMFVGCSSLVSVVVPYTVTSIGIQAFYQCESLEYVYFESADETLGETEVSLVFERTSSSSTADTSGGTFAGTPNLVYVNIPDRTTQMSYNMFHNSGIQNVVIGAGVTEIPDYAFNSATNLQSVQFGETEESESQLTTIAKYGFNGAAGSFELILPEGFTTFSSSCFVNATGLTKVYIPSTTKTWVKNNFNGCTSLAEVVFATDIEGLDLSTGSEFSGCTSLTSITLPAGITKIGDSTFADCTSLKEAIFETKDGYSSLSSIGSSAFSGAAFTSFTFPETDSTRSDGGKISLSSAIFQYCDNLTEITLSNGVQTGLDSALGQAYNIVTVNLGTCTAYGIQGGILYGKEDGTITYTLGDLGDSITIPWKVTSIGAYSFQYVNTLKSVAIPTSVSSIGNYAFYYCDSLESVTFYTPTEEELDGETYTEATSVSFGNYCFMNCKSLKEITLPEGATSFGSSYSAVTSTFNGCTSLEKVVLSSQTTRIGRGMFSGCSSLKIVTYTGDTDYDETADYSETGYMNLPDTIEQLCQECFAYTGLITAYVPVVSSSNGMNSYVFYYCENLTTVRFNPSANATGQRMFEGCTSLKEITIPATASITSIMNWCFTDCTNLESVEILCPVTTLQQYAFDGCTSLTSITLPDGLTTIYSQAFRNCSSLEKITIPSTVTTFNGGSSSGSETFMGCSSLKEIVLPNALTTLNNTSLFQDCTSLVSVTFEDVTQSQLSKNQLGSKMFYGCTSLTTVEIPSYITLLNTYCFQDCASLEEIDLSNITSFYHNYAFAGCTSLKTFTFPELTYTSASMGTYLFYGCTSLEYVDFTNVKTSSANFTTLGNYMFKDCTSLKTVILPDTVTYLGTYTFQGCTALEEFTMPSSLKNLGTSSNNYPIATAAYTFEGCTNLRKVVLNDSCLGISAYVFHGCESLKIVTYASDTNYNESDEDYYMRNGYFALPSKLVAIGNYAFAESGLVTVTLPKFTTTTSANTNSAAIGTHAFENCVNLTSVTFNDSSTVMGTYMFAGCTALESISLPSGITSVSTNAFQGCTSLAEVFASSSLSSIGEYAFDGCTALETFDFPSTLLTIGDYAFRNCASLTEISLPEFLETIGDFAFVGSGLKEVYIPENVSLIGAAAFNGCESLAIITIDSENEYYTVVDGNMIVSIDGKLVSVLSAVKGDVVISGSEITEIGESAFYGATGITKATITGVKAVGAYAFEGTALSSVEIGAVTEISDYAFYGLSSLVTVTFTDDAALETIGEYAFANTGIIAITLPQSVKTIGEHAFENTAMTSLTLDGGVESVGAYAFANIETLQTVTIDCAAAFGEGTFSGCTSLTGVTFGTNAKIDAISDYMFSGCTSLTAIAIPEGVVAVGGHAFENSGLKTVTLAGSVESIGEYAFAGSALTAIEITANVSEIGDYAFYGCEDLATADLSKAAEVAIGGYAFADCASLSTVTFGDAVVTIGDYAFENDTAVAELSLLYENTLSIGEGAFSGWTAEQSIKVDSTKYLALRKWMSSSNDVLDIWLTGCEATFVYAVN